MLPSKFLKSTTLLVLLVSCCMHFSKVFSQSQKEVANWKTWVLKDFKALDVKPIPGDKETQIELEQIKKLQSGISKEDLQQIHYWDMGSPSYHWNETGYQLSGPELFTKPAGGNFWRSPMAWMNIAIYDAIVAAWDLKYKYNRKRPYEVSDDIKTITGHTAAPAFPCEHTVTSSAAAHVLAYFFPQAGDSLRQLAYEAGQSRIIAGVQFPSDVAAGWEIGKQVAEMVIEKAKMDGSDKPWNGKMPVESHLWKGTFPVGAIASNIKPLVLASPQQLRPGPPPDFTNEMNELKKFKQNFYTISQAYRWAALSGLDIWTDLASQKIFEYRLDRNTPEAARIYTLLHVAIHDAAIAIMDAKYAYFGTRPDQLDKEFKPLLGFTPPFPGYPSGHATASSTAAIMLAYFFPADAPYFKKLAKECADSRFYAGIHFPTDNSEGLKLGEMLANYIIENWAEKDGSTNYARK